MNIGALLEFPEGYGGISKSTQLYLLDNSISSTWTFLVEFIDHTKQGKHAFVQRISREDFEVGLDTHAICLSEKQPCLPPWLECLEGLDLHGIEGFRSNARKSNLERAEERLCLIQPLIARADEIFGSDDPAAQIGMLAREFAPRTHPGRIRVWLCCYLAFGREIGALYPSFARIGHWNRKDKDCQPLGRSTASGTLTYFHVDEDRKKHIEESFADHVDLGKSMRETYARMVIKDFNCTTVGRGASRRIVSKDGKSFPSINQVMYCAKNAHRPELISQTIYGEARERRCLAPGKGRYSEGVANVFEQAEADGYFRKDLLRALDGTSCGEKLCVVRLVDVASAAVLGIGFALGSETAAAYRMALFCASIKKSEFGRLFGIEISDEYWPSVGVPAMISLDRGAGAGDNLQDERMLVPWRELVASYAPQDKATVESSHPRTKKTEGRPQTFESALTPIEAVKEEIIKVGKDNWGSNASERLTPEMINAGVLPNPMSIWNWLNDRGRTSAERIDFARAVRTFLSPVEFNATRDSLKLHARHFMLSEGDARFHRSLPRGQTVSVDGYAMNLCVRHAWITVSNRLIEVSARLPIRDCDEQLYSSIEELVKEEQRLRSLNTEQRKLAVAAEVGYQDEVEKETGKAPKSGRWVSGQRSRPSKSQAEKAAQDAATMPGGNR